MNKNQPTNLPDDRPKQRIWTVDLLELAKGAAVVWAVGQLIVLLVVGVGYSIDVMLLGFAGGLFSIFLRGSSDLLSKYTRLGEKWSLAAAVLLIVAVVAAGVSSLPS